MDIRDEFEKLDEIKRKLISVNFNESLNRYESKNPTLIECFETALWLNGAWYAFQEQQRKIDICEKLRDSQFDKLWNLTQAIEGARVGADEDFDLFLNHLSNTLKGE